MISKVSNFSGPTSTLFKLNTATASGWQIIMMYTGKKTTSANWTGAAFNSLRLRELVHLYKPHQAYL